MSAVTVRLDRYDYQPGQTVTGEVICHFRSKKEFRKLRIRLKGRENTHWTRTESYYDSSAKRNRTRTVHCSGDRNFLLNDDIVHGEGELSAGDHRFPIRFTLPHNIPSSFSCSYGGIAYSILFTVDRPFRNDFEDSKAFQVFAPIRVANLPQSMRASEDISDEKTVCCCCCANGNIELQVSLDTKTFLVGQSGHIKVYCLNMSNINVEALNVELKQQFSYKTTSPSTDYKYDSELVATSYNSGVGAHGDKTYNLFLEIPPSTQVPNFVGCDLFQCEYKLKVNASLTGCHTDLDVSTHAALAHIPADPTQVPVPRVPSRSSWETIEEYADDSAVINNLGDDPPPVFTPTAMPTPLPGYGFNVTPYPPINPSAPSASSADAPSAPPSSKAAEAANSGVGNASTMEPPPPSYDEAVKGNNQEK